jgi:tetratricopeptide (TPR) repeat protein
MHNPVRSETARDYNMALRLFTRHQISDSLTAVNRQIKAAPNFGPAYALRANIYCAQDKNKLALEDIDKALGLEGTRKNPDYYEIAARAHYQNGDVRSAVGALDKAIKLDPNCDDYYRVRSKMWTLLNDEKRAFADINEAIRVQDPRADSNYKVRGDIYMHMKKYEEAAADYTSAIKRLSARNRMDVDLEKFYSSRAAAYEKLGKRDLAAKDKAKVQSVVKDGWGAFLYEDADRKK